jgi:HK97 gp10 family phage protein
LKRITLGLSQREIQQAIKQVEQYKKELNQKCQLLVQALTDKGIEIAKFNVQNLGAFYTGELESSIDGYFSPSLGVGIVYAGSWYAIYVEFGTGIRGEEAQHPMSGNIGWAYDVNDHGESGWVYFNERDGQYHWTDGMPSRPFMYDTVRELDKMCEVIARRVFK